MIPFVALKALSFLPFGSLLKGGSLKVILIGALVAAVAFGIWKWKDGIRTAVYNQVYQERVEEQLNAQRRQMELAERLMTQREQAVKDAFEAREELQRLLAKARSELRAEDFEAGEVPPVIIRALELIKEAEQEKDRGDEKRDPGRPRAGTNSVIEQWRARFLDRGEGE